MSVVLTIHKDGTLEGLEEVRAYLLATPARRATCLRLIQCAMKGIISIGEVPQKSAAESPIAPETQIVANEQAPGNSAQAAKRTIRDRTPRQLRHTLLPKELVLEL